MFPRRYCITAVSAPIDTNYVKPLLRAETFPGYVAVTFNKQQLGVCLYSRLKGSLGWDLPGRPKLSPFKDRRGYRRKALQKPREYMALC